MNIELRTIPECPNVMEALELFQQALSMEYSGTLVPRIIEVGSDAQAVALDFHGSPTFVVDGADLFSSAGPPGVTCRICRVGGKIPGLPSLDELRLALRNAPNRPGELGLDRSGTAPR